MLWGDNLHTFGRRGWVELTAALQLNALFNLYFTFNLIWYFAKQNTTEVSLLTWRSWLKQTAALYLNLSDARNLTFLRLVQTNGPWACLWFYWCTDDGSSSEGEQGPLPPRKTRVERWRRKRGRLPASQNRNKIIFVTPKRVVDFFFLYSSHHSVTYLNFTSVYPLCCRSSLRHWCYWAQFESNKRPQLAANTFPWTLAGKKNFIGSEFLARINQSQQPNTAHWHIT